MSLFHATARETVESNPPSWAGPRLIAHVNQLLKALEGLFSRRVSKEAMEDFLYREFNICGYNEAGSLEYMDFNPGPNETIDVEVLRRSGTRHRSL